MSIGDFLGICPESLTQAMLVGILLSGPVRDPEVRAREVRDGGQARVRGHHAAALGQHRERRARDQQEDRHVYILY